MATPEQIQQFADQRFRRRAEQLRNLLTAMKDDRAAFDAIYAHFVGGGSWDDARLDGPPNLATGNDLMAMNTLEAELIAAIEANAQYAIALKLCVRPVLGDA